MVAFNESVTNLQEFNALLRESISRLSEQTQSVETESGTLQQLETQTGSSLDELNSAIDHIDTSFEGQATHAGEEVQQLTAAAAKGSDSRLAAAQHDIDERASSVEQALAHDGATLESDWSDLHGSGFEPADSVLTSLATETEALQHGAEQGFDDADAQLASARTEAAGAQSAVEGAASGFASDTDGQQGAAEEVAQVAALLDQAAGEISTAVEAVATELERAYDALAQEAGQATDELVTEVSGLIEGAGTGIDQEGHQVEQGVSQVGEGASAQLVNVLTQTETLVSAGESVTEPCTTLVPELAKCRDIAGEIERLLQAMA
jgi:hypothetical protein